MIMTIEEAVAMQGTEFIYQFSDGDTIQAYVKKFDPEKGMSCWSFGLETENGFKFKPRTTDEAAEVAICVIGFDFRDSRDSIEEALTWLTEIHHSNRLVTNSAGGTFAGCPL